MPQNSLPKFGLRPSEAAFALDSDQLLRECVSAQWLKPVIHRHKLVLYDASDVAKCWARILIAELPQPF